MEKAASPYPVLPGKDARAISELGRSRPDEWAESRRRIGITMERAYEQVTPMGTFVVAYLEADRPIMEAEMATFSSDLPFDRDFAALIKDIHGFDPANAPDLQPPELLGDWADDNVSERKRGLAFSVPVVAGREDAGRAFAKEAYETRRDEFTASRRAKGITRESVTLNHTPMGDVIAVYIEGDDPAEGNRLFARSQDAFDVWFKEQCKGIFPPDVDFNQPLPPITPLFDSEELPVTR